MDDAKNVFCMVRVITMVEGWRVVARGRLVQVSTPHEKGGRLRGTKLHKQKAGQTLSARPTRQTLGVVTIGKMQQVSDP